MIKYLHSAARGRSPIALRCPQVKTQRKPTNTYTNQVANSGPLSLTRPPKTIPQVQFNSSNVSRKPPNTRPQTNACAFIRDRRQRGMRKPQLGRPGRSGCIGGCRNDARLSIDVLRGELPQAHPVRQRYFIHGVAGLHVRRAEHDTPCPRKQGFLDLLRLQAHLTAPHSILQAPRQSKVQAARSRLQQLPLHRLSHSRVQPRVGSQS